MIMILVGLVGSLMILLLCAYLLYVMMDITRLRHQLEFINDEQTNQRIKMHSRNRQVIRLAQQINCLLDNRQKTFQQYVQSKKRLELAIHNVSHDLRTPLTISSGYAQMLLRNNQLTVADQTQLIKINQNLASLTKNLDSLLLYNRLSENRIEVKLNKLNVSDEVNQMILNMYDVFNEKDIQIDINIASHISWSLDTSAFKRILQNILGNILDHGYRHAQIELHQDNGWLVLNVENDLRQPIQQPQKLLDRFYMEDLSRRTENAGLGLYIISELVKLMDGKVDIMTLGLTFKIKVAWPSIM